LPLKPYASEAQEAFAHSQDEVPVDTGALKKSGRVRPETGVFERGNEVYVELTYGGSATEYCSLCSRKLRSKSPSRQSQSTLEDPMTRQVNGISGRIADKVERATKGMLTMILEALGDYLQTNGLRHSWN
jgi:hypothetical protein